MCFLWVLLLSTPLALPSASAQANPQKSAPNAQDALSHGDLALSSLDGSAGLAISMQISQLEELGGLVLAAAGEARGSISLATLGISALLGWNPLQTAAWGKSGFAIEERIYLQVESFHKGAAMGKKGNTLWRSRVVLPAKDVSLAKQKLASIRFGERARVDGRGAEELASLLGIKKASAKKLKKRLEGAGVFLLAKPSALPGLLVLSQVGKLFVVDHLRVDAQGGKGKLWGKGHSALLAALAPSPTPLSKNAQAREALSSAGIGVWLNPEALARAMSTQETSTAVENPACGALRGLTQTAPFSALSLRGSLHKKKVQLDLRWHLREGAKLLPLLTTEEAPVLASDGQALHAVLRLNQIGELRKLPRAAMAQTWDALWQRARRCHLLADALVMASDWPHVAGLFLEELSALHPEASVLIDNLGSLAIHAEGDGENQLLLGEAWLRAPGATIAKRWLETLFGAAKSDRTLVQWGRGPMRPYALDFAEGSVIGSNPASSRPLHAQVAGATRGTAGASLFTLQAKPAELHLGNLNPAFSAPLRAWQRLSADLSIDKGHLRFTIDLQKD